MLLLRAITNRYRPRDATRHLQMTCLLHQIIMPSANLQMFVYRTLKLHNYAIYTCYIPLVTHFGFSHQMHTFLSANNRVGKEDTRASRHKPHRDQTERRHFNGKSRHPSRSRSPTHRSNSGNSNRRSSPPPYSRQNSTSSSQSKQPPFHTGAGPKGPTVCALCLGREACDMLKCQSSTLWDGSKARCRKNEQGRLVSPTGLVLCFDWNIRRGCTAQGHDDRHECSGCGNKDHGAQKCPRAQKK